MGTRTDGDVAGTDLPATDVRTAVTELWYMWVVSLVSAVGAVYFATTRDLVSTPAEPFYALIFGIVAFVTAVYGAYTVRKRTTPF